VTTMLDEQRISRSSSLRPRRDRIPARAVHLARGETVPVDSFSRTYGVPAGVQSGSEVRYRGREKGHRTYTASTSYPARGGEGESVKMLVTYKYTSIWCGVLLGLGAILQLVH
jgi:hypothetical protein